VLTLSAESSATKLSSFWSSASIVAVIVEFGKGISSRIFQCWNGRFGSLVAVFRCEISAVNGSG
jgi:hypothetical protein